MKPLKNARKVHYHDRTPRARQVPCTVFYVERKSADPAEVTCKRCLRFIAAHGAA